MAESYETLSQLLASGEKLSFTQSFFVKFYQAFLYNDRWMLYLNGVATTLLVTAFALIFGILLGTFVALVRTAHDQQRSKKNILLGLLNLIFKVRNSLIKITILFSIIHNNIFYIVEIRSVIIVFFISQQFK